MTEGVRGLSAYLTTVVSTVVGVLAGGFITWICAKRYYERSSQDLEQESRRLRSHLKIILFGLHDAEIIDLTWDPQTDLPVAIRLQNLRLPGMVDNPTIEVTQRERRASSGTDQGSSFLSELVEEEPEGAAEPRSSTSGLQEDAQRRPWWRKVFRSS